MSRTGRVVIASTRAAAGRYEDRCGPVVGGHRHHQGRVADGQCADPVAGCDRPDTDARSRHLTEYLKQGLLRRRVRRVLQAQHRAAVVVIANHPDETHDRSGSAVGDENFVLAERNRLVDDPSPQNPRHG